MKDFTLKISIEELVLDKELSCPKKKEQYLEEQSKHNAVQRKIDQILDTIKERGQFHQFVTKFDDEIDEAYTFLRQKGFRCEWKHSEVTISV
jgi:hypothetical protein